METIVNTIILVLLWCINIFNGTGLDSAYHITQNTKNIVIIISILCFLIKEVNGRRLLVGKREFIIYGGMFCSFELSVFIAGFGFQAINYLWMFCLIYLISCMTLDDNTFLLSSLMCGIGGIGILYIYNNSSILSGWNENSIAMIGMDSFLLMLISLCFVKSIVKKIFLLCLSYIYIIFILPTDSRSSILFVVIGVLFAFNIIPKKIIYNGKNKITWFLLVPLIVAVCVIFVSNTKMFIKLDLWSYKQFQKPIFNGRNNIWKNGLDILSTKLFLGAGSIEVNGWHNSAVTCLVTYGCIGYIFWIKALKNMILRAFEWINDYIIQGCILSFFLLYFQQSVELGFISSKASFTGYIVLGMIFGRIRYLWFCEVYEDADN